jgi:hypothetical protein
MELVREDHSREEAELYRIGEGNRDRVRVDDFVHLDCPIVQGVLEFLLRLNQGVIIPRLVISHIHNERVNFCLFGRQILVVAPEEDYREYSTEQKVSTSK